MTLGQSMALSYRQTIINYIRNNLCKYDLLSLDHRWWHIFRLTQVFSNRVAFIHGKKHMVGFMIIRFQYNDKLGSCFRNRRSSLGKGNNISKLTFQYFLHKSLNVVVYIWHYKNLWHFILKSQKRTMHRKFTKMYTDRMSM
jgi:hypothetical protein